MTIQIKKQLFNRLSSSLLFFSAYLFFSTEAFSQGNLQIMPRRVVFEGSKRFQELNLANTGQDSAQYTISIINYRMKEGGEFVEVTSPEEGQNFADKYLRIFPRSVMLAPNESQSVKVQLTKKAELAPGEYRSHIYFRAVPRQNALGEAPATKDTTGISVRLVPVFGLSIPAIIRVGEPAVKTSLSNCSLAIKENTAKLNITFNRTGNMSVYGDLIVNHISADKKVTQVGVARGLAVYTPNAKRQFQLNLDDNKNINYSIGKLQIIYASPEGTQAANLAETELMLH